MTNWLNSLPPALRSAILGFGSTLVVIIASTFAGVKTWEDVQVAAGGLAVALISAASRFALDLLTAQK